MNFSDSMGNSAAMFNNSTPVTVWWGIPCKSTIPLFREIRSLGYDVEFVAMNPMAPQRIKLGWKVPPHGEMPLTILGEGWQSQAQAILRRRDGLHIVNGIWHDDRISALLSLCRGTGKTFGLLMEAPSNLERGWRRWVKSVIGPARARYLAAGAARDASFVMSASGEATVRFERLGFPPAKVYQFGYFPSFTRQRQEERAPGPMRILCVGLIEPFKGQDLLLEAIAQLRDRGTACTCVITGFGSKREELISRAARLGLDQHVTFPGVVDQIELERLFSTSDVLVAPGYEEPWGIRVNEALLAGLPAVVSDGVGAKEVVSETKAGAVFRTGSATALAAALSSVWREIDDDRAELLRRVDLAAGRIDPKTVARYTIEILEHALNGRSGPKPHPPWQSGHALPLGSLI